MSSPRSRIFIKTCNNTDCSSCVLHCLADLKEVRIFRLTYERKTCEWEKDILCFIDSTSSSAQPTRRIPIMVPSIPQPTQQPLREAARETWHYFKFNFTCTKAAAAARKSAHWILFINKVIHKWWDLSSVCESGADGGWRMEVRDASFPVYLYTQMAFREFCSHGEGSGTVLARS